MNDFEPTLKQYRSDFIDAVARIAAKNGGVVDIGEWSNNLAFDVLPRYHFNIRFPALLHSRRISGLSEGERNISI